MNLVRRNHNSDMIEIGPSPTETPQKRLPNKLASNSGQNFDSFAN